MYDYKCTEGTLVVTTKQIIFYLIILSVMQSSKLTGDKLRILSPNGQRERALQSWVGRDGVNYCCPDLNSEVQWGGGVVQTLDLRSWQHATLTSIPLDYFGFEVTSPRIESCNSEHKDLCWLWRIRCVLETVSFDMWRKGADSTRHHWKWHKPSDRNKKVTF